MMVAIKPTALYPAPTVAGLAAALPLTVPDMGGAEDSEEFAFDNLAYELMGWQGFVLPSIFALAVIFSASEDGPPPPIKPPSPPKPSPIARSEKGKVSALINRVDIALDTYDDIFSDFDPRPYVIRTISKDLIDEIKTRHVETEDGEIEVRFSIPERLRKQEVEAVIRKRLQDYFEKQAKKVAKKVWAYRILKMSLIVFGGVLIKLHEYLSEHLKSGLGYDIFRSVEKGMEIMGWGGVWTGGVAILEDSLRSLLGIPGRLAKQRLRVQRFARAKVTFISEETLVKGMMKPAAEKSDQAAGSGKAKKGAPRGPSGASPATDASSGAAPTPGTPAQSTGGASGPSMPAERSGTVRGLAETGETSGSPYDYSIIRPNANRYQRVQQRHGFTQLRSAQIAMRMPLVAARPQIAQIAVP